MFFFFSFLLLVLLFVIVADVDVDVDKVDVAYGQRCKVASTIIGITTTALHLYISAIQQQKSPRHPTPLASRTLAVSKSYQPLQIIQHKPIEP